MSLLEDIKDWYEDSSYPPEGEEVEATEVSHEILDSLRWGNVSVWVYQRGDEYVAVKDVEPATEMQDWGDYGPPEIYTVRPHKVVITEYVKDES